MRIRFRVVLPAFILAAAGVLAADEPRPLLKPIVPQNGVRVHVPLSEKNGVLQFKAQVPKAVKGQTAEVMVGLECVAGKSYVSTKLWESWGYAVPANKIGVLPELVIFGLQMGKSVRTRDVQVRVTSIAVEIVDPPGGASTVHDSDLYLHLKDLNGGADAQTAPRFYFADKFFQFTASNSVVKRPGTGTDPPPEPTITADADRVVIAAPMVNMVGPVFRYVAMDGVSQYMTEEGKPQQLSACVTSTTYGPSGLVLPLGAARACNIQLDNEAETTSTGATADTKMVRGKVKELRLGVMTGSGLKTPRDIVLKDVAAWVNKSDSGHLIAIGPHFLQTFLKDEVLACGSDGQWALHGRIKPDLLQDVKR